MSLPVTDSLKNLYNFLVNDLNPHIDQVTCRGVDPQIPGSIETVTISKRIEDSDFFQKIAEIDVANNEVQFFPGFTAQEYHDIQHVFVRYAKTRKNKSKLLPRDRSPI